MFTSSDRPAIRFFSFFFVVELCASTDILKRRKAFFFLTASHAPSSNKALPVNPVFGVSFQLLNAFAESKTSLSIKRSISAGLYMYTITTCIVILLAFVKGE